MEDREPESDHRFNYTEPEFYDWEGADRLLDTFVVGLLMLVVSAFVAVMELVERLSSIGDG